MSANPNQFGLGALVRPRDPREDKFWIVDAARKALDKGE